MHKLVRILALILGFSAIFIAHAQDSEPESNENLDILGFFDRTGSTKNFGEKVFTIHSRSPVSTTKFLSLTKIDSAPPPMSAVVSPFKLGSSLQKQGKESPLVLMNAKKKLQHSCNTLDHSVPALKEDSEVPAVTAYFAAACVMLNGDEEAIWTADYTLTAPGDGNSTSGSITKTGANITIHSFETTLSLACDGLAGIWESEVNFVVRYKGKKKIRVIYNNITHANLCE